MVGFVPRKVANTSIFLKELINNLIVYDGVKLRGRSKDMSNKRRGAGTCELNPTLSFKIESEYSGSEKVVFERPSLREYVK